MKLIVNEDSQKKGSWEAHFERIYQDNFERMLRYAYSITEDKILSEEVISEVFISVWNRKDEILSIENAQAYLSKCVKNLCVRKLSQTKKLYSIDLFEEKYHQHQVDPENILIGKELEELIESVTDQLTPHGRLVYDMARNKGYSNERIAKELEISEHTVRKHMSNVLKEFKKGLFKDQTGEYLRIAKMISLIIFSIGLGF